MFQEMLCFPENNSKGIMYISHESEAKTEILVSMALNKARDLISIFHLRLTLIAVICRRLPPLLTYLGEVPSQGGPWYESLKDKNNFVWGGVSSLHRLEKPISPVLG